MIELFPCRRYTSFAEAVSIESKQVIREYLQLFTHLPFLRFEGLGVDYLTKLLVDSVVFYGEEILDKLLHDLSKS